MFQTSEPVLLVIARLLLTQISNSREGTMQTWLMKQYEKVQDYLLKGDV